MTDSVQVPIMMVPLFSSLELGNRTKVPAAESDLLYGLTSEGKRSQHLLGPIPRSGRRTISNCYVGALSNLLSISLALRAGTGVTFYMKIKNKFWVVGEERRFQ